MTKSPPSVQDEYQTLLEHLISRPDNIRGPVSLDDIARVTASSLQLEGFEVTAEDLKRRYGPPGK